MKLSLENLEKKYGDCESFLFSFRKIDGLKLIQDYFDSTGLENCGDYIQTNLKNFVELKKRTLDLFVLNIQVYQKHNQVLIFVQITKKNKN